MSRDCVPRRNSPISSCGLWRQPGYEGITLYTCCLSDFRIPRFSFPRLAKQTGWISFLNLQLLLRGRLSRRCRSQERSGSECGLTLFVILPSRSGCSPDMESTSSSSSFMDMIVHCQPLIFYYCLSYCDHLFRRWQLARPPHLTKTCRGVYDMRRTTLAGSARKREFQICEFHAYLDTDARVEKPMAHSGRRHTTGES